MKRIGQSFLYIGGANSESSAISIPAQFLVQDEYDFCNPKVLTIYNSRLRHAENGGYKHRFSTPTLEGYGVDLEYRNSSKGRYLCKCERCETWVIPDFFRDVVIPGFELPYEKFEKEDLDNEDYEIDRAYLACPKCSKPLDGSLADKDRREWVHEFPTLSKRGFAVRPFDLIKYNNTPSVIRQNTYERKQDYYNFVHGLTYKSKDNQVDEAIVRQCSTGPFLRTASGMNMGVDVGKTVNVTIGRREDRKLKVVALLKRRHTDDNIVEWLHETFDKYGCDRMVIDQGPDITLWKQLIYRLGDVVHPCVYVNDNPKKPSYLEMKDDPDAKMALAMRTRGIDRLVEFINEGRVEFPLKHEYEDFETVLQHFQGMKKTGQFNEDGEIVYSWQKTGPDHYFHSTFYMMAACDMGGDEYSSKKDTAAPVRVVGANINSGIPEGGKQYSPSDFGKKLSFMF
jgi:hypothetical protein